MKQLNITRRSGDILSSILDDDDFEIYGNCKAHIINDTRRYARIYVNNKPCLLHRLIMNAKDGEVVDHINGDTLDNRKSNLRLCTPSQNSCNRVSIGGASKYKGVSFHKLEKKFYAKLKSKGKLISCGYYKNELDAAVAYDLKAFEVQGEYSRPNFLFSIIIFMCQQVTKQKQLTLIA